MDLAEQRAKAILMARNRQRIPMIGHQAPGDQARLGSCRVDPEQIEIDAIILVAGEHPLPPIATLGDAMGEAGGDEARKAAGKAGTLYGAFLVPKDRPIRPSALRRKTMPSA